MKRIFLLMFVVVTTVWCAPGFALGPEGQQEIATTTTTPLDATGIAKGVWMNDVNADTTLTVGNFNIFEENSSGGNVVDKNLDAVYGDNASKDFITFSGTSKVFGAIGVRNGATFDTIATTGGSSTTVDFYGTVITELMNVGAGRVNFKSATGTNAAAVTFTGDGTVGVDANTTVTGALNPAGAQTGTLELNSNSVWTGAVGAASGMRSVNVVGGSNTAGVSATITGAVDTYALSLGTNTLNIAGNLRIRNSTDSILTTLASSTVYGHIVETGGATTLPAALGVTVLVPSGTYIPLGTLFDIVQSAAGPGTSVVTVTNDPATNPLYTFVAEPSTTILGDVTIKATGTPIQPAVPVVDPVADVVAPALATLPATAPVIIAINALTSASAVAAAEAQLAPSTASLASPLLTYQGVRQFQALWLNRLDGCGQVSWPSENKENCKGSTADNGWWLKGFGYFGHQDSRSGFTAYDARILGSMIAYDRSLGLNTRAGLGVGYARTNIKGKVYDANTESDSYRAVAYVGHEMGSWFFDGSGSFGWNEYRDRRHVEFPGMDTTAKSEYSGQDYTAFGRAGYHLPAIFKFIVTPMASLQYTRINIDGRTEKGSTDDINMKVKSQHYDYLETGLGGKVERPFNFNSKYTFVPEAHFEWLHKLSNPTAKQTAAYAMGSAAFTTPSLETAADSYHAGVGLNLLACACSATIWSVEAGYDYYWRTDGYAANQVSMRVSRRF